MSGIPSDVRPASVAVKEAADLLMLRWTDGTLGGGEAADAEVLQILNTLDHAAEALAEIEVGRGGARRRTFDIAEAAREHARRMSGFIRDVRERALQSLQGPPPAGSNLDPANPHSINIRTATREDCPFSMLSGPSRRQPRSAATTSATVSALSAMGSIPTERTLEHCGQEYATPTQDADFPVTSTAEILTDLSMAEQCGQSAIAASPGDDTGTTLRGVAEASQTEHTRRG